MTTLPLIFSRYKSYIEKQINTILEDSQIFFNNKLTKSLNGSATLNDMIKYHLGWLDLDKNLILQNNEKNNNSQTGKYLRATLCCLACESVSGDFKISLPAAASIELVHNFSLVHDDIQDGDETRRHKPTVWKIWGSPQAINVGNAMNTLANLSVFLLGKNNVDCSRQIEILKTINSGCLKMIEGQYLDISYETMDYVSINDYIKMIKLKTAALIESSLKIGALIAVDNKTAELFEKFGHYLGLAFQIQDDILGIWGNDKKTGKPSGGDLKKKKKSLPVVYYLNNASSKQKDKFLKLFLDKDLSAKDLATLIDFLNEVNAKSFCQKLMQKYNLLAFKHLKNLPIDSKNLNNFIEISDFLINRDF